MRSLIIALVISFIVLSTLIVGCAESNTAQSDQYSEQDDKTRGMSDDEKRTLLIRDFNFWNNEHWDARDELIEGPPSATLSDTEYYQLSLEDKIDYLITISEEYATQHEHFIAIADGHERFLVENKEDLERLKVTTVEPARHMIIEHKLEAKQPLEALTSMIEELQTELVEEQNRQDEELDNTLNLLLSLLAMV